MAERSVQQNMFAKSRHFVAKKNFKAALSTINKALPFNKSDPNCLSLKAHILFHLEADDGEVLECCNIVLGMVPEDWNCNYIKGFYTQQAGNRQQSKTFFDKCLALDSWKFLVENLDVARRLMRSGDLKDAHLYLDKVDKTDKDNQESHYLRAYIFDLQGDKDKAKEHFRHVTRNKSKTEQSYKFKYDAYFYLDMWNETISNVKEYRKINPKDLKCYEVEIMSLRCLHELCLAIDCCYELIERDPNNYFAHCQAADMYFALEMYEEALPFYDVAIKLDPSSIQAYEQKCHALLRIGATSRLFEFAEEIMESVPVRIMSSIIDIMEDYFNFVREGEVESPAVAQFDQLKATYDAKIVNNTFPEEVSEMNQYFDMEDSEDGHMSKNDSSVHGDVRKTYEEYLSLAQEGSAEANSYNDRGKDLAEKELRELRQEGYPIYLLGQQNLAAYSHYYKELQLQPLPNHYNSHKTHACMLYLDGEDEEALEYANKAIRLDDTNYNAYQTRGSILWKLGDIDGALNSYRLAKDRDDDERCYEIYYNIANLLFYENRYERPDGDINVSVLEQIAEYYKKTLSFNIGPYFDEYPCYHYNSREIEGGEERGPNQYGRKRFYHMSLGVTGLDAHSKLHSSAYYNRALVLRKLGRYEEALDCLKHHIELEKDSQLAYLEMHNILLEMMGKEKGKEERKKREKEAAECLKKAEDLNSANFEGYRMVL